MKVLYDVAYITIYDGKEYVMRREPAYSDSALSEDSIKKLEKDIAKRKGVWFPYELHAVRITMNDPFMISEISELR